MKAVEVNFDAIVGPTHNYAGLAYGNLASTKNRNAVSSPRQAALEGLAKMKFLADLGVMQGVLPPPIRPEVSILRDLGFSGTDGEVLHAAAREEAVLPAAVSSASAMWAANAATVCPAADSADGRVHFSPANLISQFHRSIEARTTGAALRAIFADENFFAHHPPLPAQARFADEGAANHSRFCNEYGGAGLQVFVYGQQEGTGDFPKVFPARQTLDASRAIARRHLVCHPRTMFVRQNPQAIDAGVFHNDVAAVGNQNVFLCHGQTFVDQSRTLAELRARFASVCGGELHVIEVPEEELTLAEAVETYLFNSQIVTLADGSMSLIAPGECEHHPRARAVIERILSAGTPIRSVHFLSVRQSMRNGGGPACLRLRVVLTEAELARMHQGVLLNDALYARLVDWVNRRYRNELGPDQLADLTLLEESRAAVTELNPILKLPG